MFIQFLVLKMGETISNCLNWRSPYTNEPHGLFKHFKNLNLSTKDAKGLYRNKVHINNKLLLTYIYNKLQTSAVGRDKLVLGFLVETDKPTKWRAEKKTSRFKHYVGSKLQWPQEKWCKPKVFCKMLILIKIPYIVVLGYLANVTGRF